MKLSTILFLVAILGSSGDMLVSSQEERFPANEVKNASGQKKGNVRGSLVRKLQEEDPSSPPCDGCGGKWGSKVKNQGLAVGLSAGGACLVAFVVCLISKLRRNSISEEPALAKKGEDDLKALKLKRENRVAS
jgi:hypothetical protein